MTELHGWLRAGMRLSALGLIGAATVGCPGAIATGPTGSGGDTTTGGAGGAIGGGGAGGSTCQAEKEICDGKDNDCDGEIDNVADLPGGCACNDGETQECYSGAAGTEGIGACKKGTQTCQGGAWADCAGQVTPGDETCNSADDDCNGAVDDLPALSCGVGECVATVEACVDGVAQTCVPGQPSVEVCDGKDNNCNQLTDETDPSVGMSCMTGGAGLCAVGTFQCNTGKLECVGASPTAEDCDGKDNDCDGVVDNVPGTGGACSTGADGVCGPGIISCQAVGGMYTVDCFSIVPPSAEVCDGLDNNCSGATDENDPGGGGVCDTGTPGICGPGVEHCLNGAVECVPNVAGQPEVCNGLDDNCNGIVDDGDPGGGVGCATGVPGACGTGTTSCTNGAVACNQTVMPTPETCNGIDDDCNGGVDDGNPGGGAACTTGLLGACSPGTITCQGGQLLCLQNVQPSSEICGNAVDEDCNGTTPPAVSMYFEETFANNSKGWTIDTDWAIGPAVAGTCASATTGNDPGTDHSPSADNGIAGVVIGGCYPTTLHGDYCITSPNINTSTVPGNMFLSYWRHLHSDYPNYITNKVDVSANGGTTWTNLFTGGSGVFQNDASWTRATHNVTAQKSATFRVRFCYSAGPNTGIITGGGWNVDDVQLTDEICN